MPPWIQRTEPAHPASPDRPHEESPSCVPDAAGHADSVGNTHELLVQEVVGAGLLVLGALPLCRGVVGPFADGGSTLPFPRSP